MAKDTESPGNARGTEDSQLVRVVDDDTVFATDAQSAHRRGKDGRGREHVWVRRRGVYNGIQIEEAIPAQ